MDNLWLVEVTVTSEETGQGVEQLVKHLASLSEKLAPYVALHTPEERKINPPAS